MADVLIVCVREDELQAKALADMFERAGFTVGGAPANDGVLRSTGAGVIVWSQASIRSRPFLDAAQRVIDAEKAVVASLIDPPPPDSIGDAPAFALNGWTGDPEDPALDPLYFAVDRMVNSQRASIGAAPTQPADRFQEPPSLRPPPAAPPYARTRAAPRPYEAPARTPRASEQHRDPLGSEAEHWRAIRESRNPTDFMDYLARYGADGAFADVAELRLQQLTAASNAAPHPSSSLRDAARAAEPVRAPRRVDPPPPRVEPMRRPDPPPVQRRPDPPPPPRRREPTYARDYPPADTEPASRNGALVRVLLLVLLLGGGALAAGLYFGDGQSGSLFAGQSGEADAPAAVDALDEPSTATTEFGVGGSETAEEPVELAAVTPPRAQRRETQQPPQQRRDRPAAEEEVAVPAPRTSWNGADTATSGPVSLSPSAQAPSNGPAVVEAPPVAAPPPVVAAAQPLPPQRVAATVLFAQRPTARRITDLYPSRSLRDGVGGRVELSCGVRPDLSLSCSVASETPSGAGFGAAALAASSAYRARPTMSDGTSAVGTRTRVGITFRPPETP